MSAIPMCGMALRRWVWTGVSVLLCVVSGLSGPLGQRALAQGGACSGYTGDKDKCVAHSKPPEAPFKYQGEWYNCKWVLNSCMELLTVDPSGKVIGMDVGDLQKRLGVPVTGKYDDRTEKAVRAFQAQKGLSVDGKVGKMTRERLLK
jgi:peptidoglycan hydrolase-like protein with peptidoglycan-binding domain